MNGGIPLIVAILMSAFQASPARAQTVEAAVLPLPTQLRAGATVVRLDKSLQPEVLRKGQIRCAMFIVRCISDADHPVYRDTFIPVVYRAFQLGYPVAGEKVGAEIESGILKLSREPTAGYRCLGPAAGYDAGRNTIDARVECWQSIHFLFRTAAEVGFPDEADVPESQQRSMPA